MGTVPPFEKKNPYSTYQRGKLSDDYTELVPHILMIQRHPACQRSMDSHFGCFQLIEEYGDGFNEICY